MQQKVRLSEKIVNATESDSAVIKPPFWKTTALEEMRAEQWESLCDGCGRCCLNKLEHWYTGEISWTNIACQLLDTDSCRCKDYDNRIDEVPDCIGLTPGSVCTLTWLPPSCGYRLIAEGRDLYWWHPLVSGDPDTVYQAGVSVRGRTIAEEGLEPDDYEGHIVDWPFEPVADCKEQALVGRPPKAFICSSALPV